MASMLLIRCVESETTLNHRDRVSHTRAPCCIEMQTAHHHHDTMRPTQSCLQASAEPEETSSGNHICYLKLCC